MTTLTHTPLRKSPLQRKTTLGQRAPILKSAKPRERKCVVCAERFQPQRPMQKVCSPACAAIQGRRETEKQERANDRERRIAMKTRSDWLKEAQAAFNSWVRARDAHLPCICCGRTSEKEHLTGSSWDCGHYRSTGSAPHLRFHEDNAHRQLVFCNRDRAGNTVEYRRGLIERIGLAAVEALEADQTPRHYTIDDLKRIKAKYKAKLNSLRRPA